MVALKPDGPSDLKEAHLHAAWAPDARRCHMQGSGFLLSCHHFAIQNEFQPDLNLSLSCLLDLASLICCRLCILCILCILWGFTFGFLGFLGLLGFHPLSWRKGTPFRAGRRLGRRPFDLGAGYFWIDASITLFFFLITLLDRNWAKTNG